MNIKIKLFCFALFIFLQSSLQAVPCDPALFETEYRNYDTLFIDLKFNLTPRKEGTNLNALILKKMQNLPNNNLKKESQTSGKTEQKYDRTITGEITRLLIEKDKYAGKTGKDQYLIETFTTVNYKIEFILKDNTNNSILLIYKKTVTQKEFSKNLDEIYNELLPFYENPISICVKKQIIEPEKPILLKEYTYKLYALNGFPIGAYRDILFYSAGFGESFNIKGYMLKDLIFGADIEYAHNFTDNVNINSAKTLQLGILCGYSFNAGKFTIIPQLGSGYIFSFYDVKYNDMETYFRNLYLRSSIEVNTVFYNHTVFIEPAFTNIFENSNVLNSINLLLGIKFKI